MVTCILENEMETLMTTFTLIHKLDSTITIWIIKRFLIPGLKREREREREKERKKERGVKREMGKPVSHVIQLKNHEMQMMHMQPMTDECIHETPVFPFKRPMNPSLAASTRSALTSERIREKMSSKREREREKKGKVDLLLFIFFRVLSVTFICICKKSLYFLCEKLLHSFSLPFAQS